MTLLPGVPGVKLALVGVEYGDIGICSNPLVLIFFGLLSLLVSTGLG